MTTQRRWRETADRPDGTEPDDLGAEGQAGPHRVFEPAPPVPLPRPFRANLPQPDNDVALDDWVAPPSRRSLPSFAAIPLSIAIGITAVALWRGWQDDRDFHARFPHLEMKHVDLPFSLTGAWRALPNAGSRSGPTAASATTAITHESPAPPEPGTDQTALAEPPSAVVPTAIPSSPAPPEPAAIAISSPPTAPANDPALPTPTTSNSAEPAPRGYLAMALDGAVALPTVPAPRALQPKKKEVVPDRASPAKARPAAKAAAAKRAVTTPGAQPSDRARSQYEFMDPSKSRGFDQIGRDSP